MEKKNLKLKQGVSKLIGQVTSLYKSMDEISNESYFQGKKEAYEEILNWFIQNHNSELKYVSASSFLQFTQDKINKIKANLPSNNNEDDIVNNTNKISLSDIKFSDSRKRLNRYVYQDEIMEDGANSSNSNSSVINNNYNSNSNNNSYNYNQAVMGVTFGQNAIQNNLNQDREHIGININSTNNVSNNGNYFNGFIQNSSNNGSYLFAPVNKKKKLDRSNL